MTNQRGTAVWHGDIKGSGEISTQSGTVQAPYSTGARFEGEKGTNPEELIGAAHAGCFTMFLTSILTKDGKQVKQIKTESKVTLDTSGEVPKVVKISLSTEGEVQGLSPEEFQQYAEKAKENCPMSQLLKAVPEMELASAKLK
ncbi:OsmC family peroxiredoxin [Hymenobacter psychrophilus]|uniref:Osmotically inducible protein OsmC n=1 Tax=Hymenobacter psychrophilus TaxID=651662 RepID=A0A1H3FPW8_9BACT|nr:OsmC family peroxiredoxin [Hymenobacter psychrophilus]SDX92169.1 osmotically inducible protein OsmC [Hymenobacter psychrophilus]